MPQHVYYLVSVTFVEEKKEVICYFKNEKKQVAKRFFFKPYIIIPDNFSKKIASLISSYGFKNFEIQKIEGRTCIVSNAFNDLKQISNCIASVTSKKFLVLDPERIFLIEKDWSFFDTFVFDNDEIVKTFSKKDFSFYLFPLIGFDNSLKINKSLTISIIKKSVLSNILKIPVHKISENEESIVETFLENIYFKNGYFLSWEKNSFYNFGKNFVPYGLFESFSTIDFSNVWISSLTKNFFNTGPDTINCDCCKPIKTEDPNLLPSSLLNVSFVEDDFFYISNSPSFSFKFHKENEFKDRRLSKKKQFFLKNYPIGPFKKNSSCMIPLDDALSLLKEKKVLLSKDHDLFWFCTKKESFISKELFYFKKTIFESEKRLECFSNSFFSYKSFSFFYEDLFLESLKKIVFEIPFHLTKPLSKFFSEKTARTINSLQESIITMFTEFSESSGYRVLFSSKRTVFVKGHSSLSLTKNFSKKLKLPEPEIFSFSKNSVIRD